MEQAHEIAAFKREATETELHAMRPWGLQQEPHQQAAKRSAGARLWCDSEGNLSCARLFPSHNQLCEAVSQSQNVSPRTISRSMLALGKVVSFQMLCIGG
jgi:hypothetical protein